ncbi:MAG: cobalamin biosynthesis protein [Rhodocyclaceae bacterium]|nr:MAG: cobalamin biosynthesis protein [Rhodocyclaceae bacterium]
MTLPKIAAGLGCDRGTPFATVAQVLDEALAQAGVEASQLAVIATIEAKADEAAFLELAAARDLPLRFYSAAQLAAVEVPNPSETVRRYMGTPSVCEAAALLAANAGADALVIEKHKLRGPDGRNATVSLARFSE